MNRCQEKLLLINCSIPIAKPPITFVLPFILTKCRLFILKIALKENECKTPIKYMCPKTSRHNKCRGRAAMDQ